MASASAWNCCCTTRPERRLRRRPAPFLGQVDLQGGPRHFRQRGRPGGVAPGAQPLQQVGQMPQGRGAFMHRHRKLPGYASISLRMACRDTPAISATSVRPTRSGAASISRASGKARRTSSSALPTATSALGASRVNSSARRPGRPMPASASSQPASPRRSMTASMSSTSLPSWYFRVKMYSIAVPRRAARQPPCAVQCRPRAARRAHDCPDSWACSRRW